MNKRNRNISSIIMNQKIVLIAFLVFFIAGCNDSGGKIDTSDSLESARGFIEASLKGDIVTADKYMLQDSVNEEYLKRWDDFRQKLPVAERENYRDASIIIDSTKSANDSTDFIFYKNSYKNQATILKVVRKGGNVWKVDFKYTFQNK